MESSLKYGRGVVRVNTSQLGNVRILNENELPPVADPTGEVRSKIHSPAAKQSLVDELRKKGARNVVIIVNDVTRPTPYDCILPPILEAIREAGINETDVKLIVATGIHRGMEPGEIREIFGEEIASTYEFINHNADAGDNLVYLGHLPFGSELYVNRLVTDADFVITTGVIVPHYFAGFSGGRKSILPGVSGRQTITSNHSLLTEETAKSCNIKGNPVHLEMLDAAKKAGVDFIVNVVTDGEGRVVAAVAGDLEQAWLEGVEISKKMYAVEIEKPADLVIASAGGYPKDINVYQAQKAIDNAARATREGGVILLLAECPEGCGEKTFEDWMLSAKSLDDISARFTREFSLGGHKAYCLARVLKDKEVIMVSALEPDFVKRLFISPAATFEESLNLAVARLGRSAADLNTIIMPHAGVVVPVVGDEPSSLRRP